MTWSTSARHGANWKPKGYAKLRLERFAAHDNRCVDCGSNDRLELDHNDGNRHNWHPNNLVPRCKPCHRRKTEREAVAARPNRRREPEKHPGTL